VQKQPNAVDLQNDADLEKIGAESPEAGTTPPATSALAPSPATTPAPTGTATRPAPTSSSPPGGGNTGLYLILGGVAGALLIGFGGLWLYTR
jgi:hypothetical protein